MSDERASKIALAAERYADAVAIAAEARIALLKACAEEAPAKKTRPKVDRVDEMLRMEALPDDPEVTAEERIMGVFKDFGANKAVTIEELRTRTRMGNLVYRPLDKLIGRGKIERAAHGIYVWKQRVTPPAGDE